MGGSFLRAASEAKKGDISGLFDTRNKSSSSTGLCAFNRSNCSGSERHESG